MAGTLTQAEKTRLELIITIQGLHNSGKSINDIARITGKDWKTIKKYLDGDPEQLCKGSKRSPLDIYTGFIINSIKDGQTAMEIARQLKAKGNNLSRKYYYYTMLDSYGEELARSRGFGSNSREVAIAACHEAIGERFAKLP